MDYRFILGCVQEAAGDEDAKLNVYHGDTKIVDQAVISSTDVADPANFSWVSFEVSGLDAPADATTVDIKFELANDYYVDTDTDRDIKVIYLGYLNKADGSTYKYPDPASATGQTELTNFLDYEKYEYVIPTAVTGDNIEDYWNDAISSGEMYDVPVYGGALGTTVTIPLKYNKGGSFTLPTP